MSKRKGLSYYLPLTWILFFWVNAAIIILCVHPIGILPLILLVMFSLIGSNIFSTSAHIIQAIAFTFLLWLYAMYLPLNMSFYISWLVILANFCLNFKLQYKLLREINFPTKVECRELKIVVKRKTTDFWHLDMVADLYKSAQENEYKFGKYLTKAEKRWLTVEMNKYIKQDLDFEAISGKEKIFSPLWIVATVTAVITSLLFQINY